MYRIIGSDGNEYGPVGADLVRQWVREGRALASTLARTEESTEWRVLGSFQEFATLFAPPLLMPGGAPGPASPPTRTTSVFSILGLTMGLLSVTAGLCCYGLPFNLLGLAFSIIGLTQTGRPTSQHSGRSLAVCGLLLCGLSLILSVAIYLWLNAPFNFHVVPPRIRRL